MSFVNLIGNDIDDNINAIIQCSESVLESSVLYVDSLLPSNFQYCDVGNSHSIDLSPTNFLLSGDIVNFDISAPVVSICNQDTYNYIVEPAGVTFCSRPCFSTNDGSSSGSISFTSCSQTNTLNPICMQIVNGGEDIVFANDEFHMHSTNGSLYSCFTQTLPEFNVLTEDTNSKIAEFHQSNNCFCLYAEDTNSACLFSKTFIDPNGVRHLSMNGSAFSDVQYNTNYSSIFVCNGASSTFALDMYANCFSIFASTEVPIGDGHYSNFSYATVLSDAAVDIGCAGSNSGKFSLTSNNFIDLAGCITFTNFDLDLRNVCCVIVNQFHSAAGCVQGHLLKNGSFNFIESASRSCVSDGQGGYTYHWTCVAHSVWFCNGFITGCI